ncbi:MAG TPA: hypothetical protein VK473_02630 [Terriglobales bacterium]|nr:hypothetical protein [Terriglobales bacterium]
MLLVFLALPAVAAAPQTFVSNCDVQFRVRDGRDAEGLVIPGQRAEVIVPCVTKNELARIIEDFGKGDPRRKGRALDTVRRAKQIKVMLTPEVATQGED